MEPAPASLGSVLETSKHVVRRLLITGENRLELLVVEMQEARECFLRLIVLAAGVAVLGFLALLALNIAIVVLLWNYSPVVVLLALAGIYGVSAFLLYQRLFRLLRGWQLLSATLDQLRKDGACLEKVLA